MDNGRTSTRARGTATTATAMVAAMTDEEKRWCLDGDAPFWAGLTYLAEAG